MNKLHTLILIGTLTTLFSCQPASVSYIDPTKYSSTQSAQVSSCSVTRISDSEVRLTCPDGTSQVIKDGSNGLNGANGVDGTNGTDGKGIEVIDPCGAESQIGFDEILIRLPDRTIITYYKIDTYEHLTRLVPGQAYMTTDDTKCEFKIDTDGTVYDARGGKF